MRIDAITYGAYESPICPHCNERYDRLIFGELCDMWAVSDDAANELAQIGKKIKCECCDNITLCIDLSRGQFLISCDNCFHYFVTASHED